MWLNGYSLTITLYHPLTARVILSLQFHAKNKSRQKQSLVFFLARFKPTIHQSQSKCSTNSTNHVSW